MVSEINGKFFLRNRKWNKMYITMIVIGSFGFLLMLTMGAPAGSMLLPVIFGVIMLTTKNKPLLHFHEDYFEYKPAPLAPLVLVKYKNIEDLDKQEKFIEIKIKDRAKKLKIALNFFNLNEHTEILKSFDSILKK